ncbi:MAG TPA: hypothetical protein VII13_15390 [Vicinamibacteria bacterium]|jgi:hypothetical protein
MRRALTLVGLVLLAVVVLSPVVEALVPCPEPCVGEGPGRPCAAERCCTCCVHSRLVASERLVPADPSSSSSGLAASTPRLPLAADPRGILHVPKRASA